MKFVIFKPWKVLWNHINIFNYIQESSCKDIAKFRFLVVIWQSKMSWREHFQAFKEPYIQNFGNHGATFAGIFASTFLQPVNGSKSSILNHKTPHESLKFQEKSVPLQTNDVQAMFLQSVTVSKLNFPAIWRPKLWILFLWCQPWEHLMEIFN